MTLFVIQSNTGSSFFQQQEERPLQFSFHHQGLALATKPPKPRLLSFAGCFPWSRSPRTVHTRSWWMIEACGGTAMQIFCGLSSIVVFVFVTEDVRVISNCMIACKTAGQPSSSTVLKKWSYQRGRISSCSLQCQSRHTCGMIKFVTGWLYGGLVQNLFAIRNGSSIAHITIY